MTNDAIARELLDANSFVVLATADAEGTPWPSPVWYAQEDHREFFWVSRPDARHSRNIAVRPRIGMVVFDSTVVPGTGQAVYLSAIAEQLVAPDEIERGIAVFGRVATRKKVFGEWGPHRVTGAAPLRLYRASADAHSILDPDVDADVRVDVSP